MNLKFVVSLSTTNILHKVPHKQKCSHAKQYSNEIKNSLICSDLFSSKQELNEIDRLQFHCAFTSMEYGILSAQ